MKTHTHTQTEHFRTCRAAFSQLKMCLCDLESPVGNHSISPNLNSGLVPIDAVGLVDPLMLNVMYLPDMLLSSGQVSKFVIGS